MASDSQIRASVADWPLGALLLERWIMGAPAGSERRPVRWNRRHRDSGQARQ
jgi:hypothetical protein